MKSLKLICAAALILIISATAQASPTMVVVVDTPSQDPLVVPDMVDELGVGFPAGELISSADVAYGGLIPCPTDLTGLGAMVQVSITNLTGQNWNSLWYVADPATTLTNDDGLINLQLAFKIDTVGLNKPLVSESLIVNGIFDVGETWEFVIQDYANAFGVVPSAFGTIGVPSVGDLASSGSIIAIPAPGAILLGSLGVGLVGWLRRRRTL